MADRIVGMAERQLAMAESQGKHREALESRVVNSNIRMGYLGWFSGTFLGVAGLGAASYLIYVGKEIGGATAFVGSLVSLVGLFLYGRKRQGDELEGKRPKG